LTAALALTCSATKCLLEIEAEAQCRKYSKPKYHVYNIKESGKTGEMLREADVGKERGSALRQARF
jgi:hypothetical protein